MRSPHPAEFTVRAVALGAVLGIVFGLVTVYIALRVGLNFSASIPIAVVAITAFKRLGRPSVLEQNIVQTVGSAGESIAAGAVYTFPALLFLGYQLELWRIFWLALVGGILGVLFMVPLRRHLVVDEHAQLPYPEGTACADILIAGERGGTFARPVFLGLAVGAMYKLAVSALHLSRATVAWMVPGFRGASLSLDLSPELLGIGGLIGLQVARVIFAGSIMSAVVLIPLIYFFGAQLATPIYPSAVPIAQMSPGDIWSSYIRYIGAGGVITGGVRLVVEALPTVWRSLRGARPSRASAAPVADAVGQSRAMQASPPRVSGPTRAGTVDVDLGMRAVIGGIIAMLGVLYVLLAWKISPHTPGTAVSVVLVAVFGFFFVAVSARITGIMGSSANPISGITIAVLMLTCLLFVAAGWTGHVYEIVAISIGAIVCIAASNAGTTAQDLKTGYLVGASPRLQQLGLLIGVLTSVLLIGFTLMWLNDTQRIGSTLLPAPQAQVMAILVDGLLNDRMRWPLLFAGVVIAFVLELVGVRSLPFAVGMYLPLSATATLLVGALITALANPKAAAGLDDPFRPGVLYNSGLIAGGAICAIAVAILASTGDLDRIDLGARLGWGVLQSPAWALVAFGGLCGLSWRRAREG
jgi:putative OPT family oligopeptide transporter